MTIEREAAIKAAKQSLNRRRKGFACKRARAGSLPTAMKTWPFASGAPLKKTPDESE